MAGVDLGNAFCGGWWWCPADPKFLVPDNSLVGEQSIEEHQGMGVGVVNVGIGPLSLASETGKEQVPEEKEQDPEAERERIVNLLSARGIQRYEEESGVPDADMEAVRKGVRVDPTAPDNDRFLIRIFFADGSFSTIAVELEDDESSVRQVIANKIGLQDVDSFCLAEVPDARFGDMNELLPNDLPLTMLAVKPLNWRGRLVLRRRVGAAAVDLIDPVSIRLSYMQAVQEFVCGDYPCSPKDAFKLASLQFRIVFGAFEAEKHIPAFLTGKVAQLLPSFLVNKYPEHEWAVQILEGARRLSELEEKQLQEMRQVEEECTMDTMLMRMYLQQTHQITGRKVLVRIFLADGAFKTLPCGPHVRAHQVCHQMALKLGIGKDVTQCFCLYEQTSDTRHPRAMPENARLVMTVVEGSQVAVGPKYIFLRPDPFGSIDGIVQDLMATHFSYIQAAVDYKLGAYKCRVADVVFLSSLHAILENYATGDGLHM